jgi:hypothetical protein
MIVRCIVLAALLMMALFQTSCAVTGLDILMLLIKNDATPAKPLWQQEPVIVQTASPSLPDLKTADPRSVVAAVR